MASLLTKKLSSVGSLFISSRRHILTNFSTQIQNKEDFPFFAQYLISSFGFSEDRALRTASDNQFTAIKTPDRPESVVRFLKNIGMTDIQIKKAVSLTPRLLGYSVSNTLEPCKHEVIAGGFTEKTLAHLIRYNPMAVAYKTLLTRLQFWRTFLGNEENFSKFIKNSMLITADLNENIIPRIKFLTEYGLSDQHIARVAIKSGYLLMQNPDSIKLILEQTEKIGFPRGSKMFLDGLITFGSMKKDTFDRKVTFFKTTYGWSDEDINLAIKKYPRIVSISEEKISSSMDFLIRKVGLHPRSITLWPTLLGHSLETRVIPRHYVLSVLKSKGLKCKNQFQTMVSMPEKRFVEKCILPHKEELPNLGEEYAAACAGKTPLS